MRRGWDSSASHVDFLNSAAYKTFDSRLNQVFDVKTKTPMKVHEVIPKGVAAGEGDEVKLHAVFGYESIDNHMRWRETPVHAKMIEIIEELVRETGLLDADIEGKAMLYVKFQKEI
ncbi:hypothetical protein G7Y89_g9304 [Cudoniella acicularis]|uniref:Uncharacterized protein n=1 Tax=Cudoniella acicularis TaxID=354080 RepID=A0A8H4REX6_9HELO|nr:hypothetical protein G7Y89_g9304 [Cudoniella acicularis]